MRRAYAYRGDVSRELWSYRGRVLLHPDRAEMDFLLAGGRTVEVIIERLGRPWMWLSRHPGLSWVQWPLRREDFRGFPGQPTRPMGGGADARQGQAQGVPVESAVAVLLRQPAAAPVRPQVGTPHAGRSGRAVSAAAGAGRRTAARKHGTQKTKE